MREIKFRAWHIEDKFMFVPRRIDFPHFMIGDPAKWEVWYQYDDSDDSTPEHFPLKDISFYGDELELMQFTGRKAQGKEIYEGDIVKIKNHRCIVAWDEGEACFYVYANSGILLALYLEDIEEIIGNIYENPELMEKS